MTLSKLLRAKSSKALRRPSFLNLQGTAKVFNTNWLKLHTYFYTYFYKQEMLKSKTGIQDFSQRGVPSSLGYSAMLSLTYESCILFFMVPRFNSNGGKCPTSGLSSYGTDKECMQHVFKPYAAHHIGCTV